MGKNGMGLIAGVDEVGRGPLAGPVVAAAVIITDQGQIKGVTDSKKLTAKRREVLAIQIKEFALAWAIGWASVEEIDQLNIRQATLLAMQRAVNNLTIKPDLVQVDGNDQPNIDYPVECIIGGDQTHFAISAASIIAKVTRDQEMIALANQYPQYGFEKHKGYGTKQHIDAIKAHGIISSHRKTFAPVRTWITEKVVVVSD